MKKFFTLIAVCAMALAANAQIVSSSSRKITMAQTEFPNYNRLFVSYAPMTMSGESDWMGDGNYTAGGFAVGWLGGWSVSKTAPVYVEGGLNLKYNHYSEYLNESGEYEKTKCTFLNLNVPINVSYKWNVPNVNGLSVAPYVGLHFTYNIIGKGEFESGNEYGGQSEDVNLFDDDECENPANRFQLGWQAGIGVNYNAFYVGVGYSGEFTEYAENVNTGGVTLTLGLNF